MARPPTDVAGTTGAHVARNDPPPSVALVVMDVDGRIVQFSDEAEALLGHPSAEAVGARLSELIIPERLRPAHETGLARYRHSGTGPVLASTFEMPALRRDGTEVRVHLSVSPLRLSGRELLVGSIRPAGPEPIVSAELNLSAEFFRAIVERAPIVISVGTGGGGGWVSPTTERVFGARPGASLRDLVGTLVHPADRGRAYERLTKPDRLDEPVEIRLLTRDGGYRAVSFVAADLRDHPAVDGIVYYGVDVTRARSAEDRERGESARLLALLESLAVGVLVTDGEDQIMLANPALVDMFSLGAPPDGLTGARLAGPPPDGVRPGGWAALTRVTAVAAADGGPGSREINLRQGSVVEAATTGITVDGGPVGRLWVIHDVTASVAGRRVLEEHNRRLSALSSLKSEFIAIVSHELRTPLTSISAFIEMLSGPGELTSPDAPEALTAIARNTDRMLVLVQDLRLLSQLETGEQAVATGAVDIADLTREIGDGIDLDGREIAVRREVPDGPLLNGDEQLLRQLIHTVVGTVAACAAGDELILKAAVDEGGWTVRATAASCESVTDEQLLATPLPVLDDASRQRSAALSVLLARAIAQSHGGTLLAEVGAGETAMITVRLPFRGRRGLADAPQ
jgi:PAS domain S-box-containing protein